MKIINEKPPIWLEVHKKFDVDDRVTIYTWGDAIYNPAGLQISQELIEHESVHMKQQKLFPSPRAWWMMYINSSLFRVQQEAEAYGRQFAYFCLKHKDRNEQNKYLWHLARILTSPMYKLNISVDSARQSIRDESRKHTDF